MSWSLEQVRRAWRDQYDRDRQPHDELGSKPYPTLETATPFDGWVEEVFNDFVLVSFEEKKFWTVPYNVTDEGVQFGPALPVKRVYVPAATAAAVSSVALSQSDEQTRFAGDFGTPQGTLFMSEQGMHVVIDSEDGEAVAPPVDPEVEAVVAKVEQMLRHVRN